MYPGGLEGFASAELPLLLASRLQGQDPRHWAGPTMTLKVQPPRSQQVEHVVIESNSD